LVVTLAIGRAQGVGEGPLPDDRKNEVADNGRSDAEQPGGLPLAQQAQDNGGEQQQARQCPPKNYRGAPLSRRGRGVVVVESDQILHAVRIADLHRQPSRRAPGGLLRAAFLSYSHPAQGTSRPPPCTAAFSSSRSPLRQANPPSFRGPASYR